MKKIILLLTVLLLVTGCNLYSESAADQLSNQVTGQASQEYIKELDLKEIEQAVYLQTNQVRKDAGLRALTFDGEMTLIARDHSEDMAEDNYFSHLDLEGNDPSARALELGFDRKKWSGTWQDAVIIENIGKVSANGFEEVDQVAQVIVEHWLEEEESRDNILVPAFTHTGVGVAFDGENYLVTQNFW